MQTNQIRVLAIDPGYEKLGLAILEKGVDKEKLIHSECIKTSRKESHSKRLEKIGTGVENAVKKFGADYLAIETLYFSSNQKTAIKVAESRGVVLFQAEKMNLEVREFTPLQIKVAVTGYGRADKKQVMDMLPRLIKINKDISEDDEYDAIAVALTFFAHFKADGLLSTN